MKNNSHLRCYACTWCTGAKCQPQLPHAPFLLLIYDARFSPWYDGGGAESSFWLGSWYCIWFVILLLYTFVALSHEIENRSLKYTSVSKEKVTFAYGQAFELADQILSGHGFQLRIRIIICNTSTNVSCYNYSGRSVKWQRHTPALACVTRQPPGSLPYLEGLSLSYLVNLTVNDPISPIDEYRTGILLLSILSSLFLRLGMHKGQVIVF